MRDNDVAIIDGGGANIASLKNALARLGANGVLTRDPDFIADADHAILPGVGRALPAMQRLTDYGLAEAILARTRPTLGICLGMHLLAAESAEDDAVCLGIFPETAEKLSASAANPVPNMGWCQTQPCIDSPLFADIPDGAWFYYVHSYALPAGSSCIATSSHANSFAAAASRGNFYAVQFHPERSAVAGARLLANFLALSA